LRAARSCYVAMVAAHIPVQQHLSTSFFASLQNSFPFFCCSQQQVFTSLPVSVHFIAGDAVWPTTMRVDAKNATHTVNAKVVRFSFVFIWISVCWV